MSHRPLTLFAFALAAGCSGAWAQAPIIIVPPTLPPVTADPVPVSPSGQIAQLDPPPQQSAESATTTRTLAIEAPEPPALVQPQAQQPPEPPRPQLSPQTRPQT